MYRTLVGGPLGVNVPFEREAELATRYGFQGVGVSKGVIDELGVDGVRRILDTYNLIPAPAGLSVQYRQDEETFQKDMESLPAFCQAMADVGCTRIATWQPPASDTLPYDEHFEQLRRRCVAICEVLGQYGLRFGLEFIGPKTLRVGKAHEFIHDIDGMLDLVKAVGADNMGFLLDAWHWYASHGTAADLAKLDDRSVVVVHVNDAPAGIPIDEQMDNVRDMPGATGVIDIATFLQALDKMHYTGPVEVEPFCDRVRKLSAVEAVSETAASLDKIWEMAGLL